ncbi:phage gp6-like head-tail connector protein [Streptomyces buecherae]|uniref:phage gp6-like head-tail connector protein n=1 Tax=Streptomyces buecherae TaxID=2763006 RepID=UPI001E4F8016|nr:phage gp6-like head-tail connector protein [Streptomyces buecherae]
MSAFLQDVSALIEDYCGRELLRREGATFALYPQGGPALPIPLRYRTRLTISAVHQDGAVVTDYTHRGTELVRDAHWLGQLVTVTGSWGHTPAPAGLVAITSAEVIRWLALSPGVESERVGEVEVSFAGAGTAQALSGAARASLRPYRRPTAGTLNLAAKRVWE